MAKDILVAIICDDYFSRNWMSLLTVRDWRTRVVAEVDDPFQLTDLRSDDYQKIDLVLLDLDHLREPAQLFQILWQRLKTFTCKSALCCFEDRSAHFLLHQGRKFCRLFAER